VHPGEVVEEKISLSERFGLVGQLLSLHAAEYLAIVAQWLAPLRHLGDAARIEAARPEADLGPRARFALGPGGPTVRA
jgi:predicted AAA+ superfamily ATPase